MISFSACSRFTNPSQITKTRSISSEISPTTMVTILSFPPELKEKLICKYKVDNEGGFSLFLTDLDTGIIRQLTIEDDSSPKWSPDGEQIAFVSWRDGNSNIYIMNSDGSAQQKLTDDPGYDAQIDWSPDGNRIAYISDRDGNLEIYTLNLSTRETRRLTFNNNDEGEPVWSSDGKKIAFVSSVQGDSFEIYIMDSDGRNIKQITPSGSGNFARPVWCPGNHCLIYENEVYGKYQKYQRLFVYNFDTGEERRLFSEFSTSTESTHEWYASLSKGNQYILFWLLDSEQDLMYAFDMEKNLYYSLGVKGGECDLYP